MPRRFRSRRRSTSPRQVIQSFKKVLNFAPTARAAAADIAHTLVTGTDSVAAGQTAVTDSAVPTGAVIRYIEIQFCVTNLVLVSLFHHISIQHLRSGQVFVSPLVVGGNPQRNQVHYQMLYSIGQTQSFSRTLRFKIPSKYQRVREGDRWQFVFNGSAVYSEAAQVIYKFYR